MKNLKMEYSYKHSYSKEFGRPFSCEKEEDYLKSYNLIDDDNKIVFGLWIEFYHSANGWKEYYHIRYYDIYDKYFDNTDSKDSNTFKEFYASKEEALKAATKIYELYKSQKENKK
nr:MAG TPA: hypothetical protein [Caudoviricetes sp.]